eukprot:3415994-Amphidinium_carterae.2
MQKTEKAKSHSRESDSQRFSAGGKMSNPTHGAWARLKRLGRYLAGSPSWTQTLVLTYPVHQYRKKS